MHTKNIKIGKISTQNILNVYFKVKAAVLQML